MVMKHTKRQMNAAESLSQRLTTGAQHAGDLRGRLNAAQLNAAKSRAMKL